VPGVDIVGPIPAPWQRVTVFSAGVSSTSKRPAEARALIGYLSSEQAGPTVRAAGLDPVRRQ
jgi:molybdate transport system substrate-binding protein